MRTSQYLVKLRAKLAPSRWLERWQEPPVEPVADGASACPPPPRRRWLLVFPVAAFLAAGLVARAFLPLLLRDHPLLLMLLDSNTHVLLLAGSKVSITSFIAVAMAWRMAVHTNYYLLGRWYGDEALRWLGRRAALARSLVARVETVFRRFSSIAVFALAGDVVCLLAGSTGMSLLRFLILQLLGNALHVGALLVVIHLARASLTRVVTLIDGDATSLTVIFIVATVLLAALYVRLHKPGIRAMIDITRKDREKPQESQKSEES